MLLVAPARRIFFWSTYSSPAQRLAGKQRGRSDRADNSAVLAILFEFSGDDLTSAPKRFVSRVIGYLSPW